MKRVVVIGGGFAGAFVAKNLQNKFEVTLIDSKDYFEFTPSVIKVLVDPSYEEKIRVMHVDYLGKTHFVKGVVTYVLEKFVKVGSKSFYYDYLVIATGSSYKLPFKCSKMIAVNRMQDLINWHERLIKAREILIVGGGLVGVEVSAQILEIFSDKKVTLLQSGDKILQRSPITVQNYVFNFLTKKGVNVVLNERFVKSVNGTCYTKNGLKFNPDLVLLCTGAVANCNLVACRKVDDFLRVRSNVFLAGDVADIKEEKTAQAAEKQAKIVVHNIKSLEKGTSLKKYSSKERPVVISLGDKNAIFVYKKFFFFGMLASWLKQFVEWKTMVRFK
jgi:apoptosis-inducing factor 2